MCGDKPTILIVDDAPASRDGLGLNLRENGYNTLEAATGGEAIVILDTRCGRGDSCPDLVLLDIDLPDIKGGTLGEWIRQAYPRVPIVLLTAYGRLPAFEEISRRIDAPLETKPIDLDALLRLISETLEGYRAKRTVGAPVNVPPILREQIAAVAERRLAAGEGNKT